MKSVLATNTGDIARAVALHDRTDLDVVIVTEPRFLDEYPPGIRFALVDNLNDPSAAIAAVVAQHECSQVDHVVSLSERAAPMAGYLRSYLGLPGTDFVTMNNCTNKYAMKQRFQQHGLTTAAYSIAGDEDQLRSAAERIGWPVIVKPVIGAGVDATFVARVPADLDRPDIEAVLKQLAAPRTTSEKSYPVIVESFQTVISELHCDGYVRDGTVRFARTSRYVKPMLDYADGITGSQLLPEPGSLARQVRALHDRAVMAVGLRDGVTHFEVLQTSDGLLAGEIACRPGGGYIGKMLAFATGFANWEAHLATSLGEDYSLGAAGSSPEDSLLVLDLPIERGTVQDISSAADFDDLPGLITAQVKYRKGDVVDGLMDSSSLSGHVFLRLTGDDPVEDLIRQVSERFRLHVA